MRPIQSFLPVCGGALAVALLGAPGVFAAEAAPTADVLNCSRLSDPTTRLACFDNAAAALQRGSAAPSAPSAAAPAPRSQATPPPATAFARPAPPPPVERPAEVSRASAALRAIETTPDGRMLVTLEDGSVWQQVDDRRLASPPEPGTLAEVRRGLWGAYFIDFQGQREIRARRLR